MVTLPEASNDTLVLVKAYLLGVRKTWKNGYRYSKAGLVTTDLVPLKASQRAFPSLGQLDREHGAALMAALDDCIRRFRRGAVVPGGAGFAARRSWLGPMLGQLGFFAVRSDGKAPLAIKLFTDEADRLQKVMDKRLGESPYLGGSDYSIADIACYAWTLAATTSLKEPLRDTLRAIPNVHAWLGRVGYRPAVKRGMEVPKT